MIVITGGAGFIGSNLVASLEARGGAGLVVVDRLGQDDKWRNLGKRELLEFVRPEAMFDYLAAHRSQIEGVFHMGAISSTMETDADLVLDTNFALSQRLWRWCADNRVRLIYASSAATYGDGTNGFDDDATSTALAKLQPLNVYGWSKHLFDRWAVRQVERGYPCPPQWAGLKFFNVYGPNEYHKGGQLSVALQIFRTLAAGKEITLFRSHRKDVQDGEQRRDFVWVEDIVDIMLWLYDQPKVSGIFNAGSAQARSFLDLAKAVAAATGNAEPPIRFIDMPAEMRGNYQYFTQARMDRLRKVGYTKPPTTLEDGAARYVQTFLTRADIYR
ncbi:MAG TPA: ADP-glyceromanno-heptose 6-epimerase [Aliidongia sp.]|nr:ADP-glyceromanno-heptose 6-epimerase [Aliidongia sp.]